MKENHTQTSSAHQTSQTIHKMCLINYLLHLSDSDRSLYFQFLLFCQNKTKMKSKQQHTIQLNKYYNITIWFYALFTNPGLDIKYNNTSDRIKKKQILFSPFPGAFKHTLTHEFLLSNVWFIDENRTYDSIFSIHTNQIYNFNPL